MSNSFVTRQAPWSMGLPRQIWINYTNSLENFYVSYLSEKKTQSIYNPISFFLLTCVYTNIQISREKNMEGDTWDYQQRKEEAGGKRSL